MSVQQYFSEVDAVCRVLGEYVQRFSANGSEPPPRPDAEEEFTAIWQAVELLSRAHAVLLPMVQFELSKQALNLPDVQAPAKPTLYGPDGTTPL